MEVSKPATTTNQEQAKETPYQHSNPARSHTGAVVQAPAFDPALVALAAGAQVSSIPTVAAAAPLPTVLAALPHLTTSLGDSLGLLTYSQALQTAHMMSVGAYQLLGAASEQGGTMLLPGNAPEDAMSNTSSATMLTSLLASLGANRHSSARASLSSLVPIVPAPPRQAHLTSQYKLWEPADATERNAEDAYSTVFAALLAQHQWSNASAPAAGSSQDASFSDSIFTRPGPPPV
jgi:hypothetical protein